MSSYPRYQPFRKSWGINALGSIVVEVEAEDGTCGVGEEGRREGHVCVCVGGGADCVCMCVCMCW